MERPRFSQDIHDRAVPPPGPETIVGEDWELLIYNVLSLTTTLVLERYHFTVQKQ